MTFVNFLNVLVCILFRQQFTIFRRFLCFYVIQLLHRFISALNKQSLYKCSSDFHLCMKVCQTFFIVVFCITINVLFSWKAGERDDVALANRKAGIKEENLAEMLVAAI